MTADYTLCLVADRGLLAGEALLPAVEQAILGGCTMVQFRQKARDRFLQQAAAVQRVTDRYNIPLIVNDRTDAALALGAAGVHVGQRDMPAAAARRILGPDMLLGVSVASVPEAVRAVEDGADYLGVGAMFPTGTKADASLVSMAELARIRRAVSVPIVVIGGLCAENAGAFRPLGVSGAAAASAILTQPDVRGASARLKAAFLGR